MKKYLKCTHICKNIPIHLILIKISIFLSTTILTYFLWKKNMTMDIFKQFKGNYIVSNYEEISYKLNFVFNVLESSRSKDSCQCQWSEVFSSHFLAISIISDFIFKSLIELMSYSSERVDFLQLERYMQDQIKLIET